MKAKCVLNTNETYTENNTLNNIVYYNHADTESSTVLKAGQ